MKRFFLLLFFLSFSSTGFAACNTVVWSEVLYPDYYVTEDAYGNCKLNVLSKSNSYSGNCACPYDTAADGSRCGARSAWSRSGGASPVCYVNDSSANTINSRIEGEFEGYEYGNVYRLTNGQVWQQTSSTYNYSYKYRPRVTIRNGEMRVDGMSRSVRVTRYY